MNRQDTRPVESSRPRRAWLFQSKRRVELAVLLIVLLAAAGLRLWRLDAVPPGFTHDEAAHGHDAVAILHGARPIYQTVGYGREPLYDYLVAGLMGLFGESGNVLRSTSVLLGLTTLLFTFVWVRVAFGGPTALAAVALQAASFWSLSTSRQALRSGMLPALFTAAVFFFWRFYGASGRTQRWQMGLVAPLLGATLYTYMPARVLWVVLPAFLVYLALDRRESFRRVWRPTLLAVAIGLILALPLFAYLRAHPGAEQRLEMLDAPLEALREGDLSVPLDRARSALAGLLLPGQGDDFLAYTIPGRPVFDWLTGALFLVGLGLSLARWRDPAHAFALLWLMVGISPTLITGAEASSTRGIGALPVLFLFPALAGVAGARWAAERWGSRGTWAAGLGFVALVLVTGGLAARDYFSTWGASADVRAAYQHTLVEMVGYLERQPQGGGVGLSTIYPDAPHDPYVFDLALRRQDLLPHWFDARRALLLPPEPTARLIAPSSAALDPYFAGLAGFYPRERVMVDPDDLDPYFDVYDWEPALTLAALQERMAREPSDPSLPVKFGDALQLLGYDLRTPVVSPGGTVEIVTLWQVTDPEPLQPQDPSDGGTELVLFTHALREGGGVVGQEDRLDAPNWDWQAGDVIAQLHRFSIQTDLPQGPVDLEVGVYRRADVTRLPVVVDGAVAGDRVLVGSVQVVTP